jgi:hypothetical protein
LLNIDEHPLGGCVQTACAVIYQKWELFLIEEVAAEKD